MDFKIPVIAFGVFAVLLVSGPSLAFAQTGDSVQIPEYIKFIAKVWAEGTTSDQEFADALEYLIKEKIITSPEISVLDEVAPDDSQEKKQVEIPGWIKFNAKVWSDGDITDSDFVEGIEYLIKEEIIRSPNIQIGGGPGPGDITDLDPGTDEDYSKLIELSLELIEEEPTRADEPLTTDEKIAAATNQQTDSDLDGIPDADETSGTLGYKTDPNKADTDGDGINDLREYWWNINPTLRDSNGDFISDGESITDPELRIYPYASLDQSKDPDKDGIPTAAERFDVGTNFKIYSTDGDRYDDGMEFFGVSTKDKFLPNYVPADPLSPATPDIKITVNPDLTFWPGTTLKIGGKESTKNSYTVTNSEDSTNSYSVGASISVTATGTISTSIGDNKASLTLETKVDAAMKQTTTFTQNEETKIMSVSEAYRDQSTELGKSTTLQMWFTIENVGDDLLTDPLSELTLNLFLGNDEKPFHTETFENTITNLEPRDTLTLTIKDIPLNLEQAQRFLANEAVRVEVEHFQFGMDQVYLINAEASNLKLITVSKSGIDSRFVYLPNAMNLEQVLETANIDYQIDSTGHFTSIGNMEAQTNTLPPYKILTIYHTPNPNSISSSPSSVADMTFENGDILVIKHQIDTDGDLLSDEDELLIGTDKNNTDTDGDTLTDGFTDSTRNLVGELDGCTNPLLIDTDWDGILDGEDENPCEDIIGSDKIVRLFASVGQDGPSASAKIGEYPDYSSIFKEEFYPINSIKVPPGIAVIMYQAPNFEGWTKVFMGDHDNLYEMQNHAGSLKIVDLDEEEPWVILRQSAEWYIKDGEMYSMFVSGKELSPLPIQTTVDTFEEDMVISGGEKFNWGKRISDVDIPENYLVELYQKENFDGSGQVRVFDNTVVFIHWDLHQNVKSLKLYDQGDWKAVIYNYLRMTREYSENQAQVLNDSIKDLGGDGSYISNNQVDHLLIAPGQRVILYDGAFFKGACKIHENFSEENLLIRGVKIGMFDKASSVKIESVYPKKTYSC